MTIPLIVLAFFTAVAGGFNTPFRLTFEHFLEPSFEGVPHPDVGSAQQLLVLATLTLIVAVIGIVLAWRRYRTDELPAEDSSFWRNALAAYHVDDFYGRWIVAPGKAAAVWCATVFDPKVIDGAAHGIGRGVELLGDAESTVQTGQVRWYATGVTIAGVVLIALFLILGGAF